MFLAFSRKQRKLVELGRQDFFVVFVLSWVEIEAASLIENVRSLRGLLRKGTEFYAVVKSNAYGHGIREVVAVIHEEVDGFALNHISEAFSIAGITKKPLLIMGSFDREDIKNLSLGGIDINRFFFVVSNLEEIKTLISFFPEVKFFLKVDTGMSRLGYRPESGEFLQVLEFIKSKNLSLTGLMTHFSNVEDVTEQSYAYYQLEQFRKAKEILYGMFPKKNFLFHTAASAATMLIPESHENIVRIGISLYGLWPSLATKLSAYNLYREKLQLKSVMSWKTKIVHIHEVPANTKVGYGCTYQTSKTTRIAVLPVGYYEGYDRSLSNRSSVVIRNKRAMVIGRVCMNMIMVDITHIPEARIGEEAILIGRSQNEEITAEELADIAGTINYEIVSRIHPAIPRIVKQ